MLLVLLDESGSMSSLREDVIGSINKLIAEQRAVPEPACMGIAAFSSNSGSKSYDDEKMMRWIRPVASLGDLKPLELSDYNPDGWTPLLDASGMLITQADDLWREHKPDRCIFATFTDGQENSSKEYTKTKIKNLIQAREKSGLWVFQFLGANIDSFEEGGSLGYSAANTANYVNTGKGFAGAVRTMSHSFTTMRTSSDQVYADYAVGASASLGGNIAEDGSLTSAGLPGASVNSTTVTTGVTPPGGQPPGVPPAAAMQQESWDPPTSSALHDPKVTAWQPPQ
jgi:hypothetical protein